MNRKFWPLIFEHQKKKTLFLPGLCKLEGEVTMQVSVSTWLKKPQLTASYNYHLLRWLSANQIADLVFLLLWQW